MGILTRIADGFRENRTSGSPFVDAWLSGETWTPPSSSGVQVNHQTVLGYPAVWRAVTLISNSVAKVPLIVYRYNPTGKKEEAPRHPAYKLLRYRPNEYQTCFYCWRDVMRDALLNGNGYLHIRRRGSGAPYELLPLRSDRVRPLQYKRDDDQTWSLKYIYTAEDGQKWPIKWRDMLHIRGIGNHLIGYSLVDRARESLGLGLAAQKYGSVYFRDSAAPNVVFKAPEGADLSDEAKRAIIDAWEKRHAGADKAFRTAVIDKGMDVEAFPVSNDDAQFLETREFEARQVANWFNLPPSKISNQESESYNTLEQRNQEYRDDAIDPWLVAIEAEGRAKMLTEPQQERRSHTIEYRREALIQVDIQGKAEYMRTKRDAGVLTADEWRAEDGQNPLPNGLGENVMTPKNMILRDLDGNAIEGTDEDDEPPAAALNAAKQTVRDTVARMCRRLAKNGERAEKKGELDSYKEAMEDEHRKVVDNALRAPLRTLNALIDEPHALDDVVDCVFMAAREALPDETDRFRESFPRDLIQKLTEGRDATAEP